MKLQTRFCRLLMLLSAITTWNNHASEAVTPDKESNNSYQTEAWFSFSAQACHGGDGQALKINNGSIIANQSTSELSCSITRIDHTLVYSIQWAGDDFDHDGINDTLSFDVNVEGFSGSTFTNSSTNGETSITRLGTSDEVNVWINPDNTEQSVWDIANDSSEGQGEGQSLRVTISNLEVKVDDYQAHFNGFYYVRLLETNGGYAHQHILGKGTGLNTQSFNTPTSDIHFDTVDEFVITGAGDAFDSRSWGVAEMQFSLSINNPTSTPVWEASDLSLHGTGPTYSEVYPAEKKSRQALFPNFSWDTVPRWLAVRNHAPYTDEQIASIADHYQLVMLEKANKAGFNSVDEGIKDTAARLKQLNPNIKTLFYWNTQIHYTGYSSDNNYEENKLSWSKLLENSELYLFKDLYYWYDENNKELRDWWVNFPVEVASDDNIDGVFIDKMPKAAVDTLFVNKEPVSDYVRMISQLWESLPEDKILIGNNLRGERHNASRAFMEILDGSYLERWDYTLDYDFPSQTTADAISLSMQLMREALAQGKIINFQTTPDTDEPVPDTYEEKQKYMAKHVDFPLAIFLIIAEENAFFSYQLGVNATPSAENIWDTSYIPEFNRPLGAPLGAPVKNNYIFTRSYEYVDVWVDVKSQKAVLTWRNAL
ncbi:hypothetical protein EU508_08980 [Pseudoalteromonas fuliginea]|uniref:Uncharacterized protein n=1 Tax=Pseudoalteromonas fuliginea TaxID=1872678 RepID=A0AB73BGU9_9GAMM|nr:putative glycoside hydrolase [Pseudoalteromonas fuliginea]KAA1160580.1 hypothetical protein EU508_08980 [Pseudoalteromonas fuliginea]